MSSSKSKLLAELRLTPIVQVACKKANIGRATYYRWRKEHLEFATDADEALEHSASLVNDMAESQLISAIKDKNMTAIIFWLKNHHKSYEPRLKVGGQLQVGPIDLAPEQLALVTKALTLAGLMPITGEEETNG